MADEKENTQHVETQVEPLNVSSWQSSVAAAVNQTYSYTNSSLFCAVIAGYYKDYAYRYILTACQWLDGYVPRIHYPSSGIMSTHIAGALINGLARTITGEKLVYKIRGDKTPEAMQTLEFISEWSDANNIKRPVKNAIAFSQAIGTSLIKANVRSVGEEKKKVWWEAVRFDNAFYLADASNEVYDAEFLLRTYTDTRTKGNESAAKTQFYLTEHRFYEYSKGKIRQNPDGTSTVIEKKGDKIAKVEFRVHRAEGQSLNNTMSSGVGRSSVGWTEIPEDVRKLIKRDYSIIRINEPTNLPFPNLAVEVLINDDGDITVPTGTNFGRSLIVPIVDDLIIYEVAESYHLRDLYLGKGTVYIPKALSLGDLSMPQPQKKIDQAPGSMDGVAFVSDARNYEPPKTNSVGYVNPNPLNLPNDQFEQIPGTDPQEQQLVVNQFNLRIPEWEAAQENCLKRIAVKWGMSPKILSSFLAQGTVQMTATQIDSEDDISIAFINQARAIFKVAINRLLETTLNFYGKPHNVDIDFASPSIVNKDRILDRVIKKLEAGLINIEQAIREINPDLDEKTLQARVNEAKQEQMMQMLAAQQEMNEMGEFENNDGDLGGENLKGSTLPAQG